MLEGFLSFEARARTNCARESDPASARARASLSSAPPSCGRVRACRGRPPHLHQQRARSGCFLVRSKRACWCTTRPRRAARATFLGHRCRALLAPLLAGSTGGPRHRRPPMRNPPRNPASRPPWARLPGCSGTANPRAAQPTSEFQASARPVSRLLGIRQSSCGAADQ